MPQCTVWELLIYYSFTRILLITSTILLLLYMFQNFQVINTEKDFYFWHLLFHKWLSTKARFHCHYKDHINHVYIRKNCLYRCIWLYANSSLKTKSFIITLKKNNLKKQKTSIKDKLTVWVKGKFNQTIIHKSISLYIL